MKLENQRVENQRADETFLQQYVELDKKFNAQWDHSYEYLVNFSKVDTKPIHRWLYYQEGYSPDLVNNIIYDLNLIDKNLTIFDPFAGSGTTLLASKKIGYKSTGFEINPFSSFMIHAKTSNYTKKDLLVVKNFVIPVHRHIPDIYTKYELKIIKKMFDKENLEKIEILKEAISKITNQKAQMLLFASLLSILEDVSNYRKGGNGLKKKKSKKRMETYSKFLEKINQMLEDVESSSNGIEPVIINDSCLEMVKYKIDNFDISIFSPPYANCFDPFEVYKIELWAGEFVKSYNELRKMRRNALTSNLNADLKKNISTEHRTKLLNDIIQFLTERNLWDKRITKMIDTYFNDMFHVLKMIYDKTNKNGYCVIVIGNSAYGNLAIPADLILGQIGEKVGFTTKKIIIARNNETSSQQHAHLGKYTEYLRESIVVLQK